MPFLIVIFPFSPNIDIIFSKLIFVVMYFVFACNSLSAVSNVSGPSCTFISFSTFGFVIAIDVFVLYCASFFAYNNPLYSSSVVISVFSISANSLFAKNGFSIALFFAM